MKDNQNYGTNLPTYNLLNCVPSCTTGGSNSTHMISLIAPAACFIPLGDAGRIQMAVSQADPYLDRKRRFYGIILEVPRFCELSETSCIVSSVRGFLNPSKFANLEPSCGKRREHTNRDLQVRGVDATREAAIDGRGEAPVGAMQDTESKRGVQQLDGPGIARYEDAGEEPHDMMDASRPLDLKRIRECKTVPGRMRTTINAEL